MFELCIIFYVTLYITFDQGRLSLSSSSCSRISPLFSCGTLLNRPMKKGRRSCCSMEIRRALQTYAIYFRGTLTLGLRDGSQTSRTWMSDHLPTYGSQTIQSPARQNTKHMNSFFWCTLEVGPSIMIHIDLAIQASSPYRGHPDDAWLFSRWFSLNQPPKRFPQNMSHLFVDLEV